MKNFSSILKPLNLNLKKNYTHFKFWISSSTNFTLFFKIKKSLITIFFLTFTQVYKKKQETAKKEYLKALAAYRAENLQVNNFFHSQPTASIKLFPENRMIRRRYRFVIESKGWIRNFLVWLSRKMHNAISAALSLSAVVCICSPVHPFSPWSLNQKTHLL